MLSSFLQDIAFSFRLFRRRPVEGALAVAALALGIGLSTAMFSILWGTVLRSLPFQEAGRLVRVEVISRGERITPSDVDFLAWRRGQRSFEGMAAWLGSSFNLSGAGMLAERCNGAFVSANLFRLVQVSPVLGRDFREQDEAPGAPLVAILSAELWTNQFGGDPEVLGKLIKLNGQTTQVVGVMPPGFKFPLRQEIWLPLQLEPKHNPQGQVSRVQVLGKLKNDVSRRQAAAELQITADPDPEEKTTIGIRVTPFVKAYTEDLQPVLYLLFASSLGLLLVVCANVAGLLMSQTLGRLPEFAVRSAVGATRFRLMGQLMAETIFLALIGVAFSLSLTAAALRAYIASQGGELRSFWMDVRLETPAVIYALVIAIIACFLSTVVPSLRVTGPHLNEALKRGTGENAIHPPRAFGGVRLVVQLALTFALLVATGLTITSLGNMDHLDIGDGPDEVLTAQLLLPYATYATAAENLRFFNDLEHRLEKTVGSGHVAFASALPGNAVDEAEVEIEGQPFPLAAQQSKVPYLIASREYFRVLHVNPLQGRLFNTSDRAEGQPTVIVNQSFVRRYFGSRPPVGARIRFLSSSGPGPWRTIAGVVPDLVMGEARDRHHEGAYIALEQAPSGWMAVLLRTPGDPLSFTKLLREAVAEADKEIPVFHVATLQERNNAARLAMKTTSQVFLTFGACALLLSLLGVYGATAQSVASRTRELAIRLALGGSKADLVRLVLAKAVLQVGTGITLGVFLSLAISRFLEVLLFGVAPREPKILVIVACVMSSVGVLACMFPVITALKVQPAEVLRGE